MTILKTAGRREARWLEGAMKLTGGPRTASETGGHSWSQVHYRVKVGVLFSLRTQGRKKENLDEFSLHIISL